MKVNKHLLVELFEFFAVTNEDHKNLLQYLIKTEDELSEFMLKFLDDNIVRSISRYQIHKRETCLLNLNDFEKMYKDNAVGAMQQLFQEPLNASDIALMDKYDLTYRHIYKRLQERPYESFLGIIKTNTKPENNNSFDFLIAF